MDNSKLENIFYDVYLDERIPVSETAAIFRFRFAEGIKFNHLPGQYVWLVLNNLVKDDGGGDRRAMSIISPSHENGYVDFLIRNSESGFKTTLNKLQKGDAAQIIGPFGSSIMIPKNNAKDIVFVGGGVAIAPFWGIVSSFKEKPTFGLKLVHFYSAEDRRCDAKQLVELCNKFGIKIINQKGGFKGHKLPRNINYLDTLFYVCGSQEFVNEVDSFLNTQSVPGENRKFEENYPEPTGNLKQEDILTEEPEKNVLLRAVLDSKSHTIITDANGKIIFANPTAEKNTGFAFSEMKGNTPRLWGGMMSKQFYADFWMRKREASGFDGEIVNRRKNGEIYTVLAHVSPILDHHGTVIGYIGTEEDISHEKKQTKLLEEQKYILEQSKRAMLNVMEDLDHERKTLAEAQAKDDAMLESIGDGVIGVKSGGEIFFINKQAEEMLDVKPQELIGKSFLHSIKMVDEKDREVGIDDRPVHNALFHRQKVVSSKYYYMRTDGMKFPVSITATPIVLFGQVIGGMNVFRDITREKEIDTMKTDFISLASHQLRTPLSAMKWFSELLLDEAGNMSPEQVDLIKNINQSNERLIELVNALLNISRIESGRIIIEPEPVDLKQLVNNVVKDVSVKINERQQHLRLEFNEDLPLVNVDPKLVRHVYMNLLTNAIKYTPKNGEIVIKVYQDETNIISLVSDNGYGIPKTQQARIFQKFFRADNITGIETDGTGLGLYLAKIIVESSGGKIWFESEEKKGTMFSFSLPLRGVPPKKGEVRIS